MFTDQEWVMILSMAGGAVLAYILDYARCYHRHNRYQNLMSAYAYTGYQPLLFAARDEFVDGSIFGHRVIEWIKEVERLNQDDLFKDHDFREIIERTHTPLCLFEDNPLKVYWDESKGHYYFGYLYYWEANLYAAGGYLITTRRHISDIKALSPGLRRDLFTHTNAWRLEIISADGERYETFSASEEPIKV
jgi:hypothetical protein